MEIVGMSLVGVSIGLAVTGHLQATSLRNSCAPNCSEAQVDAVSALWWSSAATAVAGVTVFGIGYVGEF
jgi:hypothetical protein